MHSHGLGTRDAARNVIAGYYVRRRFRPGQHLIIADQSGAYTIVDLDSSEGEERHTLNLPNTYLLRDAITSSESPPSDHPAATVGNDTLPSPAAPATNEPHTTRREPPTQDEAQSEPAEQASGENNGGNS